MLKRIEKLEQVLRPSQFFEAIPLEDAKAIYKNLRLTIGSEPQPPSQPYETRVALMRPSEIAWHLGELLREKGIDPEAL